MAIKIGNNNIELKVGSADCTVYLGETLMYSGGTPQDSGNVITYSASAKLPETTDFGTAGALHTNAFSGTSGQLTITSHTFENGVGTIVFNGDVKRVGTFAFRECYQLTSITIPSSVSVFIAQPFWGCTSLTSITIKATTAPTLNGLVFDNTNNCPIYVPCNSIADYSIAIKDGLVTFGFESLIDEWTARLRGISSCTTIARWNDSGTTCSGESGYDKYTIAALQLSPDSGSTWSYVSPIQSYVSSIEENSEDCGYVPPVGENNVIIYTKDEDGQLDFDGDKIKDEYGDTLFVESHTFDSIALSGMIVFNGDIYQIGEEAFAFSTHLESIVLPSTIMSIDDGAFQYRPELVSFTIHAENPPSLGTNVFDYTPIAEGEGTIYVPSMTLHYYTYDATWGQFNIEPIAEEE